MKQRRQKREESTERDVGSVVGCGVGTPVGWTPSKRLCTAVAAASNIPDEAFAWVMELEKASAGEALEGPGAFPTLDMRYGAEDTQLFLCTVSGRTPPAFLPEAGAFFVLL